MELRIKSMPIGWLWQLTTDEGRVFEHVSIQFGTIFKEAYELNARVIEGCAVKVEDNHRFTEREHT